MNKTIAALFSVSALFIAGCSTPYESQVQETHVVVTPATSKDIYLVVSKPLNDNDDVYDPSQGVVMPIGRYNMECEDINYWYFRAPKPLVLALYEFGHQTNGMRLYGGIAISKTHGNLTPNPSVYVDDTKNGKVLIWNMTKEFFKNRGEKWRLSTDPAWNAPADAKSAKTK